MKYEQIHLNLPIFAMPCEAYCLWYCAGKLWILTPQESSQWRPYFHPDAALDWDAAPYPVRQLRDHALEAQRRYDLLFTQPFCPECLTIYLSYDCNLNCSYCYTKMGHGEAGRKVDLTQVEAAARYVAKVCRGQQRDFVLVLHGGGEPTYHWSHLQSVYRAVRAVAVEYSLGWYSYLATNGLFARSRAVWLAKHIGHIGLSCDGPPDIQAAQRPSPSWPHAIDTIKENARAIQEAGGRLDVRATITPQSSPRQSDIVIFLAGELGARTIRFEPIYGYSETGFRAEQAEQFAHDFLQAQRAARDRDSTLLYSGVRLQDVHSTYCDALRNTIRLLPEGVVSNCFYASADRSDTPLRVGAYDDERRTFCVSPDQVAQVKRLVSRRPSRCSACINRLHCSGGCPDSCAVDTPLVPEGFRCRLNHRLTLSWIQEAAVKALSNKYGPRMGIPVACG